MKNKFKINKGFTLVEMIIAVSLFVVVTTVSAGAIISVFDANNKARTSKTVVDNLNLAIENMARTVRFGGNYHCGNTGTLTSPQDCWGSGDTFLAVAFGGSTIIYRWNGTESDPIQRSDNGGSTYTNITASDVKIQRLRFYVRYSPATPSDYAQASVTAVIKGYVGSKQTTRSEFSIQTLMSQRTLDYGT
jgi:prepilin-type N-terminal cleavage/methylation domain-containing protein